MEELKDGVFIIGTLESVGPVLYGEKNNPDKAGQPVKGFYKASIAMSFGGQRQVTFNDVDRDTEQVTAIYLQLANKPELIGRRVLVRVIPKGNGRYVNYDGLSVELLPEAAEAPLRQVAGL